MDEQGYNGWANRATWATALHWDNDASTYGARCEMVDEACEASEDRAEAVDRLAEVLEGTTDEMVDELLGSGANEWARLYVMDMMADGVDWAEIAGNWIDEDERVYGMADEDEDDTLDPDDIPADWPVRPLKSYEWTGATVAQCGTCQLLWDDAIITSMTPAPSARCPFENFHR